MPTPAIDPGRVYSTAELVAATGLTRCIVGRAVGNGHLSVASRPRRPREILGRDALSWLRERRLFGSARMRRHRPPVAHAPCLYPPPEPPEAA